MAGDVPTENSDNGALFMGSARQTSLFASLVLTRATYDWSFSRTGRFLVAFLTRMDSKVVLHSHPVYIRILTHKSDSA